CSTGLAQRSATPSSPRPELRGGCVTITRAEGLNQRVTFIVPCSPTIGSRRFRRAAPAQEEMMLAEVKTRIGEELETLSHELTLRMSARLSQSLEVSESELAESVERIY